MPIQKENLIVLSGRAFSLSSLIGKENLSELLRRLDNLPACLKKAINDDQFSVYFDITQEAQDPPIFDAIISDSNSIQDFIKTILSTINENYFGLQEDNKQMIYDYVNYTDEAWSEIRDQSHIKYVLHISNLNKKFEGGFSSQLDCIKLNYDFNNNYDDINNIACVIAHELTHAVDYNRQTKNYNSSMNINSAQAKMFLEAFGIMDTFYDPEQAARELITYTIQTFLAYGDESFQQALMAGVMQKKIDIRQYVGVLILSINNHKDGTHAASKEFLEKIIIKLNGLPALLEQIKSDLTASTAQELQFQDSAFVIEEIQPLVKMRVWFEEGAMDVMKKYSNQTKLHSELYNSNGPIGMWYLVKCLQDPKNFDANWDELDVQEQLVKYTDWLDKFLQEKERNNPHIPRNFKFDKTLGLIKKYFFSKYFSVSKQIEIDELVKRLDLLLRKEVLEKDLVTITEESEFHNIRKKFKEIEFELAQKHQLQQEAIEREGLIQEEVIGKIELLYAFLCKKLIYEEQLDRKNLDNSQLEDRMDIALTKINEFFELLQKVIEQQPSYVQMLFIRFEEIIRKHEEQIAILGIERINSSTTMQYQNQQLAKYRQWLNTKQEQQLQQRTRRPDSAALPARDLPSYRQETESSKRKWAR